MLPPSWTIFYKLRRTLSRSVLQSVHSAHWKLNHAQFYLQELCCLQVFLSLEERAIVALPPAEEEKSAPLSVTTVPEESTMVELPSAYRLFDQ